MQHGNREIAALQTLVTSRLKAASAMTPDLAQDLSQPRSIAAEELFRGATEVIVWHAGVPYRLRVTRNDKLILTK